MMRQSKHNKEPQRHKTKEELIADLNKRAEFVQQLKFAREIFYPALCQASVSIEDAKMLLSGFNSQIVESFLGFMKEKKVKDLNLTIKLDPNSPKHEDFKKLLALFEDMSVFEAKTHIEGMRGDIDKFISDELSERPLSSLPTKWIDEL